MNTPPRALPETLLRMLACPVCEDHPPLALEADQLRCPRCHRVYPIRDGIPVLLKEEAVIENDNPGENESI